MNRALFFKLSFEFPLGGLYSSVSTVLRYFFGMFFFVLVDWTLAWHASFGRLVE